MKCYMLKVISNNNPNKFLLFITLGLMAQTNDSELKIRIYDSEFIVISYSNEVIDLLLKTILKTSSNKHDETHLILWLKTSSTDMATIK